MGIILGRIWNPGTAVASWLVPRNFLALVTKKYRVVRFHSPVVTTRCKIRLSSKKVTMAICVHELIWGTRLFSLSCTMLPRTAAMLPRFQIHFQCQILQAFAESSLHTRVILFD